MGIVVRSLLKDIKSLYTFAFFSFALNQMLQCYDYLDGFDGLVQGFKLI